MGLWRVDVAGVSTRLVEAESKKAAREAVRDAIIDALDIQASLAPQRIAAFYGSLGPLQKKSFLAATDGLSSPTSRRSASAARRRLERLIAYDDRIKAWREDQGMPAPVDPEGLARLAMYFEVERIETAKQRLKEHERGVYSDEQDGSGYAL